MIKITGSRLPGLLLNMVFTNCMASGNYSLIVSGSSVHDALEIKIVPTSCYYCKTYNVPVPFIVSGKNN